VAVVALLMRFSGWHLLVGISLANAAHAKHGAHVKDGKKSAGKHAHSLSTRAKIPAARVCATPHCGDCFLPTSLEMQMEELSNKKVTHRWWNESQRAVIDWAKQAMIGKGPRFPGLRSFNAFDRSSMGWWDSYRRATMLEPLVADILQSDVRGDFAECGVFRGGISLVLAVMLRTAGQLSAAHRRMWLADAFAAGMPPLSYTNRLLEQHNLTGVGYRGNTWAGSFVDEGGTIESVSRNVADRLNLTFARDSSARRALEGVGVNMLKGYLNESLPGGISRLALLRVDVDGFAGTYEALLYLYPLLSIGGYVVFDDWKIYQSQQATLAFRAERNISTPMFSSRRSWDPPMQTLDCMVYWRKDEITG
jgi:hypothetical protein